MHRCTATSGSHMPMRSMPALTCPLQSFLLAAIKAHWYLRTMPRGPASDPRVVLRMVDAALAYMSHLVRSRTERAAARVGALHAAAAAANGTAASHGSSRGVGRMDLEGASEEVHADAASMCGCPVPSLHVRWLGLVAFTKVFMRKQAAYRDILCVLRCELRRPLYRNLAWGLRHAVDDAHSAVLIQIQF